MSLTAGVRIGAYEIVSLLGAGGMGEVYRARDTRLGREVAIKVLPEAFANDAERLARFQREAQLLASLNHPHIAIIHGLEESAGSRALVMELVEGPTLADRIAQGPIPMDEALPIARQIAEALEAAHDRGVIHRDLKPANIKLTADGQVKVLDFGLAKLAQEGAVTASGMTMSPTLSVQATIAGVILGTAAYMSPEQARGKPVDRRTDIWSFGCVLFEMLTGKQAFDTGETLSDAVAAILKNEPSWTALPADTPANIRRILRLCLQKDPQKRLPHISMARFEIDDRLERGSTDALDPVVGNVAPSGRSVRRTMAWIPWVLAGALAVALLGIVISRETQPLSVAARPLRMTIELGAEDATLLTDIGPAAALSPDGQMIAFVAQKSDGPAQLYIRRLDQLIAMPLAGTNDARGPFFSPDARWVAFFAGGKLKKVSVTGGAVVTVADAPSGRGGVWTQDDTIVFSPNIGGTGSAPSLQWVSSSGGPPEQLIPPGTGTQRWPQLIANGTAVLYTKYSPAEGPSVVVQSLPAGELKVLQAGGGFGRYLRSGHLVYIQDSTLFAAPFDLERLEFASAPVPVLDGVASTANLDAAQFSVSDDGAAVYLPGLSSSRTGLPIDWMDREGRITPLRGLAANWSNPAFAPDGRRLAVDIADGASVDVWIYDWARDALSRLTFEGFDTRPVWTPDGRRIVFGSARGDKVVFNLYWQAADGTGEVQRLAESKAGQFPTSWHPGGKILAFDEASDVMMLSVDGDEASGWNPGTPTAFLSGPYLEREAVFSPDGRWVAYTSFESGRAEVYVRPFPGPGGKWQVSTGGGDYALWSRAGAELFYSTPDQRIMVVSYAVADGSFRAGRARPWSEARFTPRPRRRSFDLHPDGTRFAAASVRDTQDSVAQDRVVFISNFFDELRRLAPAP